MQSKFNDIIASHESSLVEDNKIFNFLGYFKLVLIAILLFTGFKAYRSSYDMSFVIPSFVEFITLVVVWIYHYKLQGRIKYSLKMIEINKRHLSRLSGDWINFEDIGEEFISLNHPYASDLDIVGKKSLFQLLNLTNTWHGRVAFANDLLNVNGVNYNFKVDADTTHNNVPAHANYNIGVTDTTTTTTNLNDIVTPNDTTANNNHNATIGNPNPNHTTAEINDRQQAILELSKNIKFSNDIEYQTSKIGTNNSIQKLVITLKDKKIFLKNRLLKMILNYLPLITLPLMFIVSTFKLSDYYIFVVVTISTYLSLWAIGAYRIQKYLKDIDDIPSKLNAYSCMIKSISEIDFTSNKLIDIKSRLVTSTFSAEHAIKSLGRISDRLNVKGNAIIYFLLNVLMLWDYRTVIKLDSWKEMYADQSEQWFLLLGELESMLSFSNLANICNNVSMPTVMDTDKTIKANNIGHPLLVNDNRVDNDIEIKDNILIISGSNMSGKTTFLRTVGINLVLAQAGCFVCANDMKFSPMKIMTSMRVADDLNAGVSTFYAELKRIGDIVKESQKHLDTIFLIDEIFRGTNSEDRLIGAKTVITKLNDFGVVGIITTHDLELCELGETSSRIINYNFSEYYQDNHIHFSYKINTGKSTTTNAKYLMQLVGIY